MYKNDNLESLVMDGVIAGKWSREGQWMNLHRSEDE